MSGQASRRIARCSFLPRLKRSGPPTQVNALGRVVNVSSPNLDARELVDAVQMTALQYRFEPLALEDGGTQFATLRIQREQREVAP